MSQSPLIIINTRINCLQSLNHDSSKVIRGNITDGCTNVLRAVPYLGRP